MSTDGTRRVPEPPGDAPPPAGHPQPKTKRVEEQSAPGSSGTLRVPELGASGTFRVPDAFLRAPLPSPPSHAARMPLGTLEPGSTICGDCKVLRTIHPHESQRPGLYLCQAPEGQVVVKVAAAQHPPKSELWSRLTQLRHHHVLRTFRTLEDKGFFCEVQEYCSGGTLEARIPHAGSQAAGIAEWIIRVMVPQVHQGLKYLHEQEIIHRDIKPANIYVKNGSAPEALVLGDFDISAVLEQSRTSRDTQRVAGTWIYTAPEAFPRFVDDYATGRRGRVTRSADYYSLGVTIIELLVGTTSLHLCELPDLFDFYLQGGRVEVPRSVPEQLALLLRGLLIRNRNTRWGADEIERWLAGTLTDVDRKRIREDEQYELARASEPYKLNDAQAVDLPSLAEAMSRQPDAATYDLMSGDRLINWIARLDSNIARVIHQEREQLRKTPEVALFCAIIRCDPTRPFILADGVEAQNPYEWSARADSLVKSKRASPDALASDLMLHKLEWWLRLKSEPEVKLAEAVAKIRGSKPNVRLEEVGYLFQQDRPYLIAPNVLARTPNEIVALTYGKPEQWSTEVPAVYRESFRRWQEGFLSAWLRQRMPADLVNRCEEIAKNLGGAGRPGEPGAAFETILRQLAPSLPQIRVQVDTSGVSGGCFVPYGEQRTYTLSYRAEGCGVPFGALQLRDAQPGLSLEEHLIRERKGTVSLRLDSRNEIPASRTFYASISLDSGIAKLDQGPAKVSYGVTLPVLMTVLRVAAGAVAGAAVLGVPRLLMTGMGLPKSLRFDQMDSGRIWEATTKMQFPYIACIIGVLILAGSLYGGWHLWLQALRNSES